MNGGSGNDQTPRRVADLEYGLQKVVGRLETLERSSRTIEQDIRVMKDQINSMQSSIQEMLMIFRNLSEKVRSRVEAEGNGARNAGAAAGGRPAPRGRIQDEVVRDPRHLREDEDRGD
jgi:DNA anti-recombination protein RmuC